MCGTKIVDPLANLRTRSRPTSVQGPDRECAPVAPRTNKRPFGGAGFGPAAGVGPLGRVSRRDQGHEA